MCHVKTDIRPENGSGSTRTCPFVFRVKVSCSRIKKKIAIYRVMYQVGNQRYHYGQQQQ